MANISYAWEKLHLAILSLTGEGTRRERLENAVFGLHTLTSDDFPEDLQSKFSQLWADMNRMPAQGNEGTIHATVSSIDENEIRRAIETVISLHDRITRLDGPM